MCIDPPLPSHVPPARPNSSHIMAVTSAPLAMVWPWPRWVEVMKSLFSRLRQTPAATASWPIDRWTAPLTNPSREPCSARSSNALMRAIVR